MANAKLDVQEAATIRNVKGMGPCRVSVTSSTLLLASSSSYHDVELHLRRRCRAQEGFVRHAQRRRGAGAPRDHDNGCDDASEHEGEPKPYETEKATAARGTANGRARGGSGGREVGGCAEVAFDGPVERLAPQGVRVRLRHWLKQVG